VLCFLNLLKRVRVRREREREEARELVSSDDGASAKGEAAFGPGLWA
jgi:hypothetical protein